MGKNFLGEFEELVLLAIMKLDKQAYGVRIATTIEKATNKRVSIGALYTTLGRLEDRGFLTSWTGDKTAERGGRPKKFYRVEIAGRSAIAESERGRRELGALVAAMS